MKKLIVFLFFAGMFSESNISLAQSESYLNNRIIIEGVYKRNLGNFSEVWANSTGGYIGYGIAFPDHNLLILRTGYYSNSLKDGVNYNDATSNVIPIHIGGRYYFVDSRFMPFISFMNGLNLVLENTNLEGDKADKTLVRYAWEVGFGLSVSVIGNLYLDLNINYSSHFYTTEAMMTGFSYGVGLAWSINN
jgi:hypothetical protein